MKALLNFACVSLSVLASVLLSSCTSSPARNSSRPNLEFEVRFAHESAQSLRAGGPVHVDGSRVGTIRRVEHKFELSLNQTRTYALVHLPAGLDLRVEDRISILFDEAAKENYIAITLKEGDRSKWRPIERGMLVEGEGPGTFTKKLKGAPSSVSEKIKNGYQTLKNKFKGQ